MGFFEDAGNTLANFGNFLRDAWSEFTSYIGELVNKIVNSIIGWIRSIIAYLKPGDFVVTEGTKTYHAKSEDLEKELGKELANKGLNMQQYDSNKQAEILQNLVKKSANRTHDVPVSTQEKTQWKQTTGGKTKLYQLTN